jgi:acetoacetyl-[acyl-carrier protein] synthase
MRGTLIRKIEGNHFDVNAVQAYSKLDMDTESDVKFTVRSRKLPNPIPENWEVTDNGDKTSDVVIKGGLQASVETYRENEVQGAGQLPTGFDPAAQYNSRFHPRGLQLAVLAASDALNSIGVKWEDILDQVDPDEVGVYATSAMGQNDEYGYGGMFQARLRSGRVSSKQLALGLTSMPTDFVNAYVTGNVGATGSSAGACASFLYNLRLGVDDIKSGRRRVVVCGCSEAPLQTEIIEGYSSMGALATVEKLAKLDGVSNDQVDFTRSSRPFSDNCGFTLGESAQYVVLMDDKLAMELGATIHGAVNDVFVNADGFKKSISSPGAGNYITLSKAVASARAILGEEVIRTRSYVQAHGSSTPQNRVTESEVLDKVAAAFGIESWPITSIKAYYGHPTGPASGDQLASAIGSFETGILPGIKTITSVADDVLDERLDIMLQDKQADMDVCFLNTKGFGGNNATASVLSPNVVKQMLVKRYGEAEFKEYQERNAAVKISQADYEQQADQGYLNVIYNFGEGIIDDSEIKIDPNSLSLPGRKNAVNLALENPFSDMV